MRVYFLVLLVMTDNGFLRHTPLQHYPDYDACMRVGAEFLWHVPVGHQHSFMCEPALVLELNFLSIKRPQ